MRIMCGYEMKNNLYIYYYLTNERRYGSKNKRNR